MQDGEGLAITQMRNRHDNLYKMTWGCKMTLALKICVAGYLSIGLLMAATAASGQSGPLKDQINDHEQKLAEARAKKDIRSVAVELNTLGKFYREAGNTDKALDDYNQALAIEHSGSSRGSEAAAPNGGKERGPLLEQNATPAVGQSNYSHPFYWAPFVLIGNYQ
jgi:tetratricopeptide (TPR) repeat protein